MSAQTADSQFTFRLPRLSYIDADWEKPDLRPSSDSHQGLRQTGFPGWLSRQMASFAAWRRHNQAARELAGMSDRQLADIGILRPDTTRALSDAAMLRRDGLADVVSFDLSLLRQN